MRLLTSYVSYSKVSLGVHSLSLGYIDVPLDFLGILFKTFLRESFVQFVIHLSTPQVSYSELYTGVFR